MLRKDDPYYPQVREDTRVFTDAMHRIYMAEDRHRIIDRRFWTKREDFVNSASDWLGGDIQVTYWWCVTGEIISQDSWIDTARTGQSLSERMRMIASQQVSISDEYAVGYPNLNAHLQAEQLLEIGVSCHMAESAPDVWTAVSEASLGIGFILRASRIVSVDGENADVQKMRDQIDQAQRFLASV